LPSPGSPLSAEESECRICYNRFDLERHAPKMLGCLHTFCRGSSWASSSSSAPRAPFLACPVCRALTALPAGRVQNLPVNTGLVEAILLQLRGWEPLLRDLRPQRLLWPQPGSPSPPASSASSASPSPSLSPSGVVLETRHMRFIQCSLTTSQFAFCGFAVLRFSINFKIIL
uniref:RING-type domain-containing protein n=1 Tax=Anolis carolinensis TaxID=28377 RepID=A0A803T4U3_ANOCA